MGLHHIVVSLRIDRNNQVLIASRYHLDVGDLSGSDTADGGGASNALHVRVDELNLEVVGIRVPLYQRSDELRLYWDGFAHLLRSAADRRIAILGDLNANPDNTKSVGGKQLAASRNEEWQMPQPVGEWSFYRVSHIDHVLASSSLSMPSATYVTAIAGVDLASANTTTRVSDHAALVVDLDT